MKRGEIYYIKHRDTFGAEIEKARPGVIVSNDALNKTSDVVEVVYLTTKTKKDLPTHAIISATGRESTVLCEQIDSVSVLRIGDYCGTCSEDEMIAIDHGLRASLDLGINRARLIHPAHETIDQLTKELGRLNCELKRVKAERDRYARMLDLLWEEDDEA